MKRKILANESFLGKITTYSLYLIIIMKKFNSV
jgi:hypothetical protein